MNMQLTIAATGILKRPPALLPPAGGEEEYVFILATQGLVRSYKHGWHDAISYLRVTTQKVPTCLAKAEYGDPIRVIGYLNADHLVDFQGRQKSNVDLVATKISCPMTSKKTSDLVLSKRRVLHDSPISNG